MKGDLRWWWVWVKRVEGLSVMVVIMDVLQKRCCGYLVSPVTEGGGVVFSADVVVGKKCSGQKIVFTVVKRLKVMVVCRQLPSAVRHVFVIWCHWERKLEMWIVKKSVLNLSFYFFTFPLLSVRVLRGFLSYSVLY